MKASIGVVILNYNDVYSTIELLNKIKNYDLTQVVVVDNCSTDNSYDKLSTLTEQLTFKLIKSDKNGGYSYGNNIGLKYLVEELNVDISIIVNPDVIFENNILAKIEDAFKSNPSCGLVSPVMLDKNGNETRMWLKLPKYINSLLDCSFLGRQFNKIVRNTKVATHQKYQKVDILPGSFLAFRSSILSTIGYLDENVFLFYEENIIGEKMKKYGFDTYLLTDCQYIHNHSVTIKKNLSILNTYKHNLRSKLYYEKEYHNISSIQSCLLQIFMGYGILELKAIIQLRSMLGI